MGNEILEIDSNEKKTETRDLVHKIEYMLKGIEQSPVFFDRSIYKVPKKIREINEAAYTPRVVSIGPLHHEDERLKPMQELKLACLKAFLERTHTKLEDIIHKLKEDEVRIRGCYAQSIPQSSDDLVSMILIDACFIIEYLSMSQHVAWFKNDLKPWLQGDILLDLILLENQLPFFVLEDLFTLISSPYSSFLELSFHKFRTNNELTFDNFCEHHLMKRQSNGECEQIKVKHFTDLKRILYLPHLALQPKREARLVKHLYSASQLLDAGVKFMVSENKSITELGFANGVLRMPHLGVYDRTETLLRNVVALEQCHYPFHTYITDYIQLLDFLINNSKDVDILVDKGIMTNWVGDSNKVSTMVNRLFLGVTVANTSAANFELCKNLNDFCNRPLQKYKAILMRDYFSTPWKIASVIAAIVLLILTLIQTICAVISSV